MMVHIHRGAITDRQRSGRGPEFQIAVVADRVGVQIRLKNLADAQSFAKHVLLGCLCGMNVEKEIATRVSDLVTQFNRKFKPDHVEVPEVMRRFCCKRLGVQTESKERAL